MPGHRASSGLGRNVHFVNSDNDEIGGLCQNGSLTWGEVAEWMQIVYELPLDEYRPFPCLEQGDPAYPFHLHGPPITLQGNTSLIEHGFYVLLSSDGSRLDIPINPEDPVPRNASRTLTGLDARTRDFRDRVRQRDGRCVVTGEEPVADFFDLQAAHIFPVAHIDLWRQGNWVRQITDDQYSGDTGIHSVQNGLLLTSGAHLAFDKFLIAINPDNDYKVVSFIRRPQWDGVKMYQNQDVPAKYQPCRALLKHHFRMALLCNMKGRAGYPVWDDDIPSSGCDQIQEISDSEQGQLRLELMLAERLNGITA
ncbi:hypothetical protein V8E54_012866 [Elaphomyces granulatus]|jgi:hypothetical protein